MILISAVSAEHRSLRATIAALLDHDGYDTDFQEVFGTEQGDIIDMLAQRVDKCDSVIQLIGQRYGFAPPVPHPEFGECSYTQFEALYARSLGKPVRYVLLDNSHPTDNPAKPDPIPASGNDPAVLQADYRKKIKADTSLDHSSRIVAETRNHICDLRLTSASVREERGPRHCAQKQSKSRTFSRFVLGCLLGVGLGLGGGFLWCLRIQDARFLMFQVQSKIGYDLWVADYMAAYSDPAARASYQKVLSEAPQWSDALLNYAKFLHTQSQEFLSRGQHTEALADAQECLILAQRLYALDKTQVSAQNILKSALDQMGDLLLESGSKVEYPTIFEHRQQSLALAEALHRADIHSTETLRGLSASLWRMGDLLDKRGQPGDAEAALQHYTRNLEINEKILTGNPESAQRMRDVFVSLEYLGIALSKRNQPGDSSRVVQHFDRCVQIAESLLKANPTSELAASDLADIYMEYGNYAKRSGQGDAQSWWKRAHGILIDKQKKGLTLSPNDRKFLDFLHELFGK